MVPNPNVPNAKVPNPNMQNSKAPTWQIADPVKVPTCQIVDVIKSRLTGLSFFSDKHALRDSLGLG
jgi:hypothetical protein